MNISGILVQTKPEFIEEVISNIKKIDQCDYHMHDEKGRIVVTIEGEGVSEEIAKLNELQKIDHVISADLMYAYAEDELNAERDKLEEGQKLPDWLNDPDAKPEDIKYNGDLRGKRF